MLLLRCCISYICETLKEKKVTIKGKYILILCIEGTFFI